MSRWRIALVFGVALVAAPVVQVGTAHADGSLLPVQIKGPAQILTSTTAEIDFQVTNSGAAIIGGYAYLAVSYGGGPVIAGLPVEEFDTATNSWRSVQSQMPSVDQGNPYQFRDAMDAVSYQLNIPAGVSTDRIRLKPSDNTAGLSLHVGASFSSAPIGRIPDLTAAIPLVTLSADFEPHVYPGPTVQVGGAPQQFSVTFTNGTLVQVPKMTTSVAVYCFAPKQPDQQQPVYVQVPASAVAVDVQSGSTWTPVKLSATAENGLFELSGQPSNGFAMVPGAKHTVTYRLKLLPSTPKACDSGALNVKSNMSYGGGGGSSFKVGVSTPPTTATTVSAATATTPIAATTSPETASSATSDLAAIQPSATNAKKSSSTGIYLGAGFLAVALVATGTYAYLRKQGRI